MRELIVASESAELLLPLTTALEGELGMQPRVAREVEEVAEDIRVDFSRLRKSVSESPTELVAGVAGIPLPAPDASSRRVEAPADKSAV